MVEGARLESVYTGNRIKGSNPFVSAQKTKSTVVSAFRRIGHPCLSHPPPPLIAGLGTFVKNQHHEKTQITNAGNGRRIRGWSRG